MKALSRLHADSGSVTGYSVGAGGALTSVGSVTAPGSAGGEGIASA